MSQKQTSPPQWALRFLRFYCRKEFLDEIEGDLIEIFQDNVSKKGAFKAKITFLFNVFQFFKWSNIKRTHSLNSNSTAMLKNYFLIARRNMLKEKLYSVLNLTGLYIGFLCLILTAIYFQQQIRYDKHHLNVENTYRFLIEDKESGHQSSSTGGPWAPRMAAEFPEINNYVRIGGFGTTVLEYGEQQFYETNGLLADTSFFSVFNYDFKWGSPSTALNEPYDLVLTSSLAQKYFGEQDPIGEFINFNQKQLYKVTGVLAEDQLPSHLKFNFIASYDSDKRPQKEDWMLQNYVTYLELVPDVNKEEFKDGLKQFFEENTPQNDFSYSDKAFGLEPLDQIYLYSTVNGEIPLIRKVITFAFIGLLILIIALVNYINLVTARSTKRLKEVGVRKAIGAHRNQLIMQFLTESFYFCFISFVLALLSVKFIVPIYSNLVNEPLTFSFSDQWALVLILLAITVLMSLLSGFYPALILSTQRAMSLLSGKGNLSNTKQIFRKVLTGLQFAISIVLIIGTAFIQLQLKYVSEKDLGFDKDQVLVLSLENSSVLANKQAFAARLEQSPFVKSVALTGQAFGGGDWGMPVRYEGGSEPQNSRFMAVDSDFTNTLGIEVVEGRNFFELSISDQSNSFIVNQKFVDQVGWTQALGKTIDIPAWNPDGSYGWEQGKIVGVVKDFNYRDLKTNLFPLVISNKVEWTNMLFVKLEAESVAKGLAFIGQEWQQSDAKSPFNYYFLDDRIAQFYEPEKRLAKTTTLYGGIAIVLACFGLFSLATFVAEQKMKEVSVRKVLGATTRQVFVLFGKPFVLIVVFSALISVPIAFHFLNGWLATFVYRIEVINHLGVAFGAIVITVGIATATILYQSLRVIKANPVQFLRNE
jgi:putative ABC transport system permease protein